MSLIKPLLATTAAAFFTGSLYLTEVVRQQTPVSPTPLPVLGTQTELTKFAVSLHVDYGNSKIDSRFAEVEKGQTVLKFLTSQLPVVTKTYSFGTSVESISSVKNGTANKYWLYYVNGQSAQTAADQYILKPGDIVTWKFEFAK